MQRRNALTQCAGLMSPFSRGWITTLVGGISEAGSCRICPQPPHVAKLQAELDRTKADLQRCNNVVSDLERKITNMSQQPFRIESVGTPLLSLSNYPDCGIQQIMTNDATVRYYTQFDTFLSLKIFFDE